MSKEEATRAQIMMYSGIQQPAAMLEDGNLALNWREWKSSFDYYMIASGKEKSTSREKCALFLHVIGKYGREIYEELDLEDKVKSDYEQLVLKFTEHCDPARNVNYERHLFFEAYQLEDSFDKFLSTLKTKSKTCDFGNLRNSLILTQIIRGVKDQNMREKLLAKQKLELEEAVSWCRAAENAGRQAEACADAAKSAAAGASRSPALEELAEPVSAGAAVNSVAGARARGRGRAAPPNRARAADTAFRRDYRACDRCGRKHSASDKCWALSAKCFRCDRVGHFAKMCRARFVNEAENIREEDYDNSELLLYNISIDSLDGVHKPWYEKIRVNNVYVEFKLDSGADASVMSLRAFKEAGLDENLIIKDCKMVLREISKSRLPVIGYFEPILQYKSNKSKQKIYVLNLACNNLLGLEACTTLNLIARINEMTHYSIDESIFNGIGCLPSTCKILINTNVAPVVNASRKIPIKLRPRLKQELENMEKLNVITKEESPTDWVSNIVIVERPNKKIRICLDPHHLNKAVRRCHFQLPTLDEITSNLAGAKYFSKLDAKNGFYMLKLDDDSSKLCTFATPFGRYRFLRMPFGISCAPEIFHREMHKIFSMEGVEVFSDDILVWGRTKEEHDARLKEVIDRAVQNCIKFNKEKCIFGVTEIDFLGHTFDNKGIRPDKKKIKAIVEIPTPKEKKELERFLGITNYLSRFIPKYSNISAPLRDLIKKDREFDWCNVHDDAFNQLKTIISNAPVLRYYSPREPVTVSVDASGHGLGACLLQSGQPVAYAARTLTPTETRWAQIEKELLAILFGCVKFHQYIYGHNEVTVETDHKPLETIFKKSLNETPPRLQRMLLKLQPYCLNLVYKPGKLMHIADALSRAAVECDTNDDDMSDDITVHVNLMYENLDATAEKLNRIKTETSKDGSLLSVTNYYHKGWPDHKKDIKTEARPYWTMRNELHVINNILFRNNKIVIPQSLRKEMLQRIHEGHFGVEKCKRRAREVMWWPGMNSQIEETVYHCEICQRHRAAGPREPLRPHSIPSLPWEKIAADIFELKRKYYLLVVDYFSKFVEVVTLPNLQSGTVISKLKSMFSRFGIPKKIVTDNGTQFSSLEFKNFSEKWEFVHVTSSPLYPRSNGLAERFVQTVKRMFIKSSDDGTEWQLALLNFRNTPISGEKYSPAQLLMGRSLNTRLPTRSLLLKPQTIKLKQMHDTRKHKINKMKYYYDRGTKILTPLKPGDKVRVRDGKVWVAARVLGKASGERSYWLKVDNGGTYRRNRSHIMKIKSLGEGDTDTGRYDFIDTYSKEPRSVCERDRAQYAQASPARARAGPGPQSTPRTQSRLSPPSSPVTCAQPTTSRDHHNSTHSHPKITVTKSGREVRPPDRFCC